MPAATSRIFPGATALLLLAISLPAAAQQMMPLWEAGIGVGTLHIPDYRGSAHYNTYNLPLPYGVYRGEKFRIDRSGLRSILLETPRVYFDLSASAGPPVNSNQDGPRRDMPDLEPTAQVGPAVKVILYGNRSNKKYINFSLPVRKVIATNFRHTDGEGYTISPEINFNYGKAIPRNEWNIGMSVGVIYADRQYHDYYYSVPATYATATRPEYHAEAGYSGIGAVFSYTRRSRDYWLGTFFIYDHLQGSVIQDSPLVERDHSWMFGIGVSWVFAMSKTLVPVRD